MRDAIFPDWPAPPGVRALSTTRLGGVSAAPWAGFNLGDHVGDDPAAVSANRLALGRGLPAQPVWLRQVHGTRCVDAALAAGEVVADASFTRQRGVVCAVMTADCLPVLLCDDDATVVGVVHAGWRGLVGGVVEATVAAMEVPGGRLMAWLGPAIGPRAFEVGGEVREAFIARDPAAALGFVAAPGGKWLCDIHRLARQRLAGAGVHRFTGADFCTVSDPSRFFSYRRDGITGRMASLVWLE